MFHARCAEVSDAAEDLARLLRFGLAAASTAAGKAFGAAELDAAELDAADGNASSGKLSVHFLPNPSLPPNLGLDRVF